MINKKYALSSLRPGEEWVWVGQDYSGLQWMSQTQKPTEAEIEAEYVRLLEEYQAQEYARKRQEEYPGTDKLIVALWEQLIEGRGNSETNALQALREAIKQKYPKP